MPDYQDRMKDYVPVNERIAAFIDAHPEGSLQSEIVELTESRVTVKAYAYRTPADPRPGTGHSSLNIPGSTPYTKGSEIENAETSAWGRAIAALGFEVKRGVSSSEEIANKQSGQGVSPSRTAVRDASDPVPAPTPSLDQVKARLLTRADEHHLDTKRLDALILEYVPVNPKPEVLLERLIQLGKDISEGRFDPVPAEDMTPEQALAAGAALVGRS